MNSEYQNYLLSDEWKQTKEKAYKFHGRKCQKCKSETNLQVHHATYEHIYSESMLDMVVLCETCHDLLHKTYGTENLKDNTFIFLNGQEMFDKREEVKRQLALKEITPEQREERLKQIQTEKDRIFSNK